MHVRARKLIHQTSPNSAYSRRTFIKRSAEERMEPRAQDTRQHPSRSIETLSADDTCPAKLSRVSNALPRRGTRSLHQYLIELLRFYVQVFEAAETPLEGEVVYPARSYGNCVFRVCRIRCSVFCFRLLNHVHCRFLEIVTIRPCFLPSVIKCKPVKLAYRCTASLIRELKKHVYVFPRSQFFFSMPWFLLSDADASHTSSLH